MSALEHRKRAAVTPANRVTVLDPLPALAPDRKADGGTYVYVHVENLHMGAPAALPVELPAPRPAPRPRTRRRRSVLEREVLRPIFLLLFIIAAVYIAHVVLADPTIVGRHAESFAR